MKPILNLLLGLLTLTGLAQAPAGYYNGAAGKTGEELKGILNDIISGHTSYPYSSTSTDVWDIIKETDKDPNNPNNVIGIYSGFSMNAADEYANGDGWNREHVWAKSRGDFGTTQGAGTDLHHLRAEDVSTNSARSNRTFAEADEPYVDASGTHSGPTESFTSSSEFIWEPRAAVKGDVARMIFYMATRYEGENGEPDLEIVEYIPTSTDKSPFHGKLSDLLAWHAADPVDQIELDRNDVIFGYQGNRNPFIDHPEYVDYIWGTATPSGPSFSSTPVTTATENTAYAYTITTSGGAGSLAISASQIPSWLILTDNGNGTASLSGTPSNGDVGSALVTLVVSDGSNSDTQSFTITVSAAGGGSGGGGNASDLLFSEYIEGSSYNKALEIANFTGSSVDLSAYQIQKQTNGAGSWSSGLALSGTLASGEVFVIAHSSASATVLAQADLTSGGSEMSYNGNDAVALLKNGVIIDVIGVFNDPAVFGADVTKVRNADITAPNTTYTTSEWTNYATDTFGYLGAHTMNTSTPNQAPTVSITSPLNGAGFTTGNTVSVSASAADSDGSIASVTFYVNGSAIGTDTSAPYSASFTIVSGNSVITATATDDQGASTTSSAVNVSATDPNQLPSVTVSAPANGATFTSGTIVSISATASDPDGVVESVEFFVNGSSAGVDFTSPYSVDYTIGEGSFVIYAEVTDDNSAVVASAAVTITGEAVVTPSAALYFSEYIEGSAYNKALEIANTSGAAESMAGYVVKKQTNGAGAWSSGISLSGTLADGEVYVIAYTSAASEILAEADLTTSATEMTYNGNDAIGLFKDGVLVDIIGEFDNAAVFGQDVTLQRNDNINTPNAVYTVSEWTSYAADTFTGLGVRSGVVSVPNVAPSVLIDTPADAAVYTEGDAVSISATASDTDGTIAQVEFFVDGTSVGVDANAPYSTSWTIGVGTYSMTAVATDDDGATTTSAVVTVTGEAPAGPVETVLTYDNFESGWGNYTSGGVDALRYSGAYAWAGSYAANIQDNSGVASSFYHTAGLNLSSYDQVKVQFYFYALSMDAPAESFTLDYYNGSAWQTVEVWTVNTDFANNNFYVVNLVYTPADFTFAAAAKFRFRCDASANNDDVFIDEITITGVTGGTGARLGQEIRWLAAGNPSALDETLKEHSMTVYPNPVTDYTTVSFLLEKEGVVKLSVYHLDGKLMHQQTISGSAGLNSTDLQIGHLPAGIYQLMLEGALTESFKLIKE